MRCILLFLLLPCFAFSQAKEIFCADSLISFGKQQLGVKYNFGSMDPGRGFDCSGFVYYVFGHFNVKVPRSSREYSSAGSTIPKDSCRPGDIIVFTGTNVRIRKPGHVGIVVSRAGEELRFIHSSSGKKHRQVVISSFTESPYYQSRFIKIVRFNPLP